MTFGMIPEPIGVRVLVTELEDAVNGIILPAGALRTRRGVVEAKGQDVKYLEVADEILFAIDANTVYEFRHGDQNYFVMPEAAVVVVLDRHPSRV